MRHLLGLSLLLLLSTGSPLHAEQAKGDSGARETTEQTGGKPVDDRKERAHRPRETGGTFESTESIGADSAVSFPVDI